jgi:hypothetical protein
MGTGLLAPARDLLPLPATCNLEDRTQHISSHSYRAPAGKEARTGNSLGPASTFPGETGQATGSAGGSERGRHHLFPWQLDKTLALQGPGSSDCLTEPMGTAVWSGWEAGIEEWDLHLGGPANRAMQVLECSPRTPQAYYPWRFILSQQGNLAQTLSRSPWGLGCFQPTCSGAPRAPSGETSGPSPPRAQGSNGSPPRCGFLPGRLWRKWPVCNSTSLV